MNVRDYINLIMNVPLEKYNIRFYYLQIDEDYIKCTMFEFMNLLIKCFMYEFLDPFSILVKSVNP